MHKIIIILIICLFSSDVFAKICRKGIPCGNTCIASWKTCHVGRGTAVHVSELQPKANDYSQNLNTSSTPEKFKEHAAQNLNEKQCVFRSYSSSFFLCDTKENKILKCNGYCASLSVVKKGTILNFFDNYKIVEFNDRYNNSACNISGCSEIKQ